LIVDTSALVAIATGEWEWEALLAAISTSRTVVPAPALTEMELVLARRGPIALAAGTGLIDRMMKKGLSVVPFDHAHARITAIARELYGKGNGRGGLLNFGDLMVYAVAKSRGEPILCTGCDFASTDLEIHPASRLSP
jgi:ribonuclease VapC